MMTKFSEWLKLRELATTTASIATVPMRLGMGLVKRPPAMIGGEILEKKKKKKKL